MEKGIKIVNAMRDQYGYPIVQNPVWEDELKSRVIQIVKGKEYIFGDCLKRSVK